MGRYSGSHLQADVETLNGEFYKTLHFKPFTLDFSNRGVLDAHHKYTFTGDQVNAMIVVKHGNAIFCQNLAGS